MNDKPEVLQWHRDAAKEIGSLYFEALEDDDFPQDSEVAEIIARHSAATKHVRNLY